MNNLITIGTHDGKSLKLDIGRLLVSRLLVTAASGGGKSWLLRKILEQVSASTQTIVIDPEGEFASLREVRDMLLVGPQGEATAEPRSAGLLCRRLMELNISAVIDVSELPPSARRQFVANFLNTMVDLPRTLWRPCFVALDEIHEFAPEGAENESSKAVALLGSKGRKRGFCLLGATQRLSKLNKDVAAELKTRFIGQTILDVDQRRAADFLGFGKDRWAELRDLSPPKHEGEFFGVGPAMKDRGVVKFRAGMVETTHPKPGQGRMPEPPAPSQKIKGVLGELKDLPQQAEAEIKDIAAARQKIALLEREISAKPKPEADPAALSKAIEQTNSTADQKWKTVVVKLTKGLEDAMKVIAEINSKGFDAAGVDPEQVKKAVQSAAEQIVKMAEANLARRDAELLKWKKEASALLGRIQKLLGEDLNLRVDVKHNEPFTVAATQPKPARIKASVVAADATGRESLTGPERKILDALAWLESIGVTEPENSAAAFLAGYTVGGGGWNNPRGALRTKGLIEYIAGDKLRLTDAGRSVAQTPAESLTVEQLHRKVMEVLPGPEQKILKPLLECYPSVMSNEDLASAAGYTNGGGGYNNPRGRLRTLGLIDYRDGGVVAREILFPG